MWASAPTNNHENSTNFEGGQSRPPLQMKFDRPFVSSNPVHQISVVPRYFRRGKSSGFANAGRIREIHILRRRGRCLHRPAESTYFMAVFRRIREIAVPRRRGGRPCPPAENARFCGDPMRIRNILMGRCGHRPLQTTAQNCTIL